MSINFDQRYIDFNLARDYPPALPEEQPEEMPMMEDVQLAAGPSSTVSDAGAAFGVFPQMKPRRGGRSDIGERVITGAPDFAAGAARGATTAALGIGGDIQKISRFISALATDNQGGSITDRLSRAAKTMENPTLLPSSEDVSKGGYTIPGTSITLPGLPPAVPAGQAGFGMTPEQRQSAAEAGQFAGELVGDPLILSKGAKAVGQGAMAAGRAGERLAERMVPQIMAKGGTLAELMQAMSQGSRSQLTAYHGSPHRIDKFSSEKIGTGEGNQSYGYGLYFAESPDVAKTYMEVNPSVLPAPIRTFKGAELEPGSPEYHAASLLDSMTLPQARKAVAGWIKGADPRMAREAEGWAKTLETLNAAQSKSDFKQLKNKGALYTVDIPDEMVGKMLEWDKPLKEQPENVRAFFADVPSPPNDDTIMGPWLQKRFGNGADVYWAQDMQKAGVPGIRYLDAGSRGASSGTRNLVIFPGGEDQIKIVKTERKK